LFAEEREEIKVFADGAAFASLLTKIEGRRLFIRGFQAAIGPLASASLADILTY